MHKFIKPALIAGGLIVLIIFSLISSKEGMSSEASETGSPPEFLDQTSNPLETKEIVKKEEGPLLVDVKGAVKNPGIYEMKAESRVADAIERAGGLLPDADGNLINLAQRLQDEMVIHIVNKGEEPVHAELAHPGAGNSSATPGSDTVNINSADEAALQTLPGIGPSKAQAIIRHREANGPFPDAESITDVSGIGQKTFENLQDHIVAH